MFHCLNLIWRKTNERKGTWTNFRGNFLSILFNFRNSMVLLDLTVLSVGHYIAPLDCIAPGKRKNGIVKI